MAPSVTGADVAVTGKMVVTLMVVVTTVVSVTVVLVVMATMLVTVTVVVTMTPVAVRMTAAVAVATPAIVMAPVMVTEVGAVSSDSRSRVHGRAAQGSHRATVVREASLPFASPRRRVPSCLCSPVSCQVASHLTGADLHAAVR